MRNNYLKTFGIIFLIVIFLPIVKADFMNITGGLYSGSFAIGMGVGGFNLEGNLYTSNMSLAEIISGANYTGGLYSGKLGYIAGLLNLPPIVNRVNLTPNNPEVNHTINCTVTATDNEGATLTIYRDWYNATGIASILTQFTDDETLSSRSLGESYYCRAKAYDGSQNSTDWVVGNTVFINDTIYPVISNPQSASTATQNDIVNFDIDCSDGGSGVQLVRIELIDPNIQVNNGTATLVSGNTYRRQVTLSTIGTWTYQSVTCKDWNNLTTLNASIGRTIVVSEEEETPPPPSGGGGGGGGGGGVRIIRETAGVVSTALSGEWTATTKDGFRNYNIYMDNNDEIDYLTYPVLVKNNGDSTINFTAYCQHINSTSKNISNSCSITSLSDTSFQLLPKQEKIIGVKLVTGIIEDKSVLNFNIIIKDHNNYEQGVTYTIIIFKIVGKFLKYFIPIMIGLFIGALVFVYTNKKKYNTSLVVIMTIGAIIISFSISAIILIGVL